MRALSHHHAVRRIRAQWRHLLDLRHRAPGAALVLPWDALYTFIGARGEDLYFRTTKDAPLGVSLASMARTDHLRTVVPEGTTRSRRRLTSAAGSSRRYVEDAHGVAR